MAAESALIALEPIIGVAIALNLAYLNLSKFAYITNVKARVGGRIRKLDESVISSVRSTRWYKQLDAMACVDTIDSAERFSQGAWVKSPGLWGFFYNVLFYWRVARIGSIALTAFCVVEILLAVGYEAKTVGRWAETSSAGKLYFEYYTTSLAMLWPIFAVVAGEYIMISAARFIDYQTDHLKDQALAEAGDAITDAEANLHEARPGKI